MHCQCMQEVMRVNTWAAQHWSVQGRFPLVWERHGNDRRAWISLKRTSGQWLLSSGRLTAGCAGWLTITGVFAVCVWSIHLPALSPGSFALSTLSSLSHEAAASLTKAAQSPKVLRCTKQLKKRSFCDAKSNFQSHPEAKKGQRKTWWYNSWDKLTGEKLCWVSRGSSSTMIMSRDGTGMASVGLLKNNNKITEWFEPSLKVPAFVPLFSSSAITPWKAPCPPPTCEIPFSDGICLQGHSLNYTSDEESSTLRTVTKWNSFPS